MLVGSIMPTFGTLGPPKGRFFAFRGALARTLAHSERTGAFSKDFGAQGGVQKFVGGEGADLAVPR